MKIEITENSISFEELKAKIESKFPDYKTNVRSKNFLVVSKSNTVGTNVVLKKKKIFVVGNFPTMIGQIIFVLSLFLLGILIPLIVYFVAFHSKLKGIEKEVAAYVQEIANEAK